MPKKIILSKLGVDELLELIHNEDTPAHIRERAIRFLKKQTETAFDR
jgi:hypothetical protein